MGEIKITEKSTKAQILEAYNQALKELEALKAMNDSPIETAKNEALRASLKNAETAAKNMLSGVEKKVTLDGINGDLSCIAGNGVEVYDKATGLNGVFWIDSDTHTWENGTHIMSLELNFKNIMDSKEYDETEE